MASFNQVTIAGNICHSIELRYTPSGDAVTDISIAINETYKKKNGETVESTVFTEVSCWGSTAENIAKYLGKGSSILVSGKLILDQWEKDGEKRSKLRVRAERVVFLGGKPSDKGNGQDGANAGDPDGNTDEIPF